MLEKPLKTLTKLSGCLLPVILLTQCRSFQPPGRNSQKVSQSQWIGRSEAREHLGKLRGGSLFSVKSGEGAELLGFRHSAEGQRRGQIVALHGLQTHAGWMAPMACTLAESGYEVWCPDRRGSGTNAAGNYASGDIGDWRLWVQDVQATVQHVRETRPGEPIHLLGYSWGGVLAAIYLGQQPTAPIQKAVFLAPGWATTAQPGRLGSLALQGVSALLPQVRVYIPTPPEVAETAQGRSVLWEDEALLRMVSLRYLRQMAGAQQAAIQNLERIQAPSSVLLGSADSLVDNSIVKRLAGKLPRTVEPPRELPGHGHLMVQEHPLATAQAILQVLK
jgi:alpha-beta hydrolase superfamily lysophospholipase